MESLRLLEEFYNKDSLIREDRLFSSCIFEIATCNEKSCKRNNSVSFQLRKKLSKISELDLLATRLHLFTNAPFQRKSWKGGKFRRRKTSLDSARMRRVECFKHI